MNANEQFNNFDFMFDSAHMELQNLHFFNISVNQSSTKFDNA